MTTNEITLSFFDDSTPAEYLEEIYYKTENGKLNIPGFPQDVEDWMGKSSLRCTMNWEYADYMKTAEEFTHLDAALKEIGAHYDEIAGSKEKAKKILSGELFDIWNTYVKNFDNSLFDMAKISEIEEKLDTAKEVRRLAKEISEGNKVSNTDKEFFYENMDIVITDEEQKLFDAYCDNIYRECEERVGNNIYAYQRVIRARRLCRLYSLKAPEAVTNHEGRFLAQALALHKFCTSSEIADYTYLLAQVKYDAISQMSDEEQDEYYRPKKMNSRKSLAPLFVYLILRDHSSPKNPLRQNEIIERLSEYPYEITVERKMLSRIIHNLVDSQLSIFSDAKSGTWMDK